MKEDSVRREGKRRRRGGKKGLLHTYVNLTV